jgi:oligopeptide/dipeptide ABC transporter ATP-binding protein
MDYGGPFATRSMASLLQVQNLRVAYVSSNGGLCPALARVNFDLSPGEILGVLGESGSGKSTLAAALLNLLPNNAILQNGSVLFENKDLLRASERDLQILRGCRVSCIFQEPSSALHPTLRISQQVSDVLAAHVSLSRSALREKTAQALETVFGQDAPRVGRSYPHELSGGQRQRVLIAQAVVCQPGLLVADEPTASLDPTTQSEILQLFRQLRDQLGLSILLITHNPLLLDGLADRILVLYAGQVVELGPAGQILASPQHPYTAALLQSLPATLATPPRAQPKRTADIWPSSCHPHLPVIPGEPPDLSQPFSGCRFESRCSQKMSVCITAEPELLSVGHSHTACCFKFAAAR